MQTSTELELNQLLEELSEIKADDEEVYLDDNEAPPPPPRDSLVFDSPLDVAVRSSQRISVNNGKISYYEEPTSRSSDRFSNSGKERFSTRDQPQQQVYHNESRNSDRFGDSGNERFSTRTSNQQQQHNHTNNDDRFSDRSTEDDRFSNYDNSNQFSEVQEYQTPKSTGCGSCSKDISGDALQALGQLFHVDCFQCKKCNKKIGTEEFFVKDNKAYCENCYKSSFLPKCSRCKKEIEGKYLKALNQDFHEKCFNCSVCNTSFSDGKFYEKDDNAYCHQHYNQLFGFTCAKCHQTITDGTAISALDKYWHRNHFTCTKCNKPFSDEKFFEDEGLPYCQEHYHERRGTICGKCNKIIDGLCVSALEKKWHQNCFTCTGCNGVLSGQVMLSENKVYCPKCADNL
eukprot:TRINITY_DN16683_c0_g1_i1.p1 TRINITY_DN16683_c0_g1~~TRINITY_DN16683_c0_g1_i1.p1  ORF type:complete len:401 (-),score=122.82 TRINITY_DN16683_c0_g1_i1:70-1272(-)